jgi:hypothetical protein
MGWRRWNLYHLAIEGDVQPFFGRSTESVTISKIEDVRFKVIMSADEFRGPVIETESTHLID